MNCWVEILLNKTFNTIETAVFICLQMKIKWSVAKLCLHTWQWIVWAVVFGRPEMIICQKENKTKVLISFKSYVEILTINTLRYQQNVQRMIYP